MSDAHPADYDIGYRQGRKDAEAENERLRNSCIEALRERDDAQAEIERLQKGYSGLIADIRAKAVPDA